MAYSRFSPVRLLLFPLVALTFAVAQSVSAAAIIQTNFVSTGSNQTLPGTQIGLATNAPGSNWLRGGGYDWSNVVLTNTDPWNYQDRPNLQQEGTVLTVSIDDNGSYTKASALSISANLYFSDTNNPNAVAMLGFWGTLPSLNSTASLDTFTGVTLSRSTGDLQLYVNGSAVGEVFDGPVLDFTSNSGGPNYTKTYLPNLISFDIDLGAGMMSNVYVNGVSTGLSALGVTDAGTNLAGVGARNSSNGILFDNLTISAVPEPGAAFLLTASLFLWPIRRRRG